MAPVRIVLPRRPAFFLVGEAAEHKRQRVLRRSARGGAAPAREAEDFSAMREHRPDNTDQGSRFTCATFIGKLEAAGIAILMDGRGRFMDNIFIERPWRSIKYQEIHLKAHADGREARAGIGSWMTFYNCRRPHQALNNNQMPTAARRVGVDRSRRRRALWICRFAWIYLMPAANLAPFLRNDEPSAAQPRPVRAIIRCPSGAPAPC